MSSVVGKGSEFMLELPIRRVEERQEIESEAAAKKAADETASDEKPADVHRIGKRLLLAEDNPASLKLIAFRLRDAGHDVTCAENGREALNKAWLAAGADKEFDAVLLDMQMPEVDGFAVARELRGLNYNRPIVALTAHALPGDRDACYEAGCSHYLAKPFDWDELMRLIDES